MLEVREIRQHGPGTSRKSLLKGAKAQTAVNDADERLECAKSLSQQGQLLRATESKAASKWSSVVLQLPPKVLRFSLNAAQDTLPRNANLAMWRRKGGLSDACKLCGARQSLSHVLNQCPVALQLRRYNTHHDTVLEVIKSGIKPLLSDGDSVIADLHKQEPYTFPTHIAYTDLHPNLVFWNTSKKTVCLVELTICLRPGMKRCTASRIISTCT